jgi:hypothetical protein
MSTEIATPVAANVVVVPAPKKRGRPPGIKNKPKAKPKATGGRKKGQTKTDLPRTARAYLNQAMGLKMPTESAAIAKLVEIDNQIHQEYDWLMRKVNGLNNDAAAVASREITLSGFRQFFVNLFAGQPVNVTAKL